MLPLPQPGDAAPLGAQQRSVGSTKLGIFLQRADRYATHSELSRTYRHARVHQPYIYYRAALFNPYGTNDTDQIRF